MSNMTENGLPPAGWYRDPNAPGSDRWWTGTGWAENVRPHQPSPKATSSAQRVALPHSSACPACGSADTKTLAMIRAQGTTIGRGTSTGWVQGTNGQPGHSVTVSTRTTSHTDAALAAAPPSKRFSGIALMVGGLLLGIVLAISGYWLGTSGNFGTPRLNIGIAAVVGVAMFGVGIVLAPLDFAYNHDVYPDALARWSRSWRCLRCGTRFLL